MPYRYAAQRPDDSDLASGRVFASLPGVPAFPVRLASEIFLRCLAIRQGNGLAGRCALYDPCCGGGYLLGVVAYLHGEEIRSVTGSDISPAAVTLAARNLALLSPAGLERRMAEIADLLSRFGKPSHQAALASARIFRERVAALQRDFPLRARVFQADALDGAAIAIGLGGEPVDIVLTDVPYGLHSQWQGAVGDDPAGQMLSGLAGVLAPGGLAAVASDKRQKVAHALFRRVDHFQVGKRRVVILQRLA